MRLGRASIAGANYALPASSPTPWRSSKAESGSSAAAKPGARGDIDGPRSAAAPSSSVWVSPSAVESLSSELPSSILSIAPMRSRISPSLGFFKMGNEMIVSETAAEKNGGFDAVQEDVLLLAETYGWQVEVV